MKDLTERAREFARELFTNGQGRHAVQLRMVDNEGEYLGGWSEKVITDRMASFASDVLADQWVAINGPDDLPRYTQMPGSQRVLVTVELEHERLSMQAYYDPGTKLFYRGQQFENAFHPVQVIAWRPLPEPYEVKNES